MNVENYPKKGELDFLCVLIGGSHLYGMTTPESDLDYRGVYYSKSLVEFMGFSDDSSCGASKEDGDDYNYFELTRFLQLCRKSNTNTLEILFAPDDAFIYDTHEFNQIRRHRMQLIDSNQLLKSCRGYVHSESRLALGERTGKLGGKRKAALEKYGYSPKNVVQILRIVAATKEFLKSGNYPIKLAAHDPALYQMCMAIKTRPQDFSVDTIKILVKDGNEEIMAAQDKVNLKFDTQLAAELSYKYYKSVFP